jgi:hypothetical protein
MKNRCKNHFTTVFKVKTTVKDYLQRFLVKIRCKMVFCSGCYIRTAVNNLLRFLIKPLLNFAALPITAVVKIAAVKTFL